MPPRRLERLPATRVAGDAVIHEATTARSRLLGLALLSGDELPPGHALCVLRCRSVHTFGMRFPIDVAFVDDRARVVRIERGVPPRRVLVERRAFAVVESRAGEIERFLPPGPGTPRPPSVG